MSIPAVTFNLQRDCEFRAPALVCLFLGCHEDLVIDDKRSHPGDDEDNMDISGPSKARRSSKKQQFAQDGTMERKTNTPEKRRPVLVLVD